MQTIELPAGRELNVYVRGTQIFDLGVVKSIDDGTAVDISSDAATLKALIKEHLEDTDAEAIAELTLEGDSSGNLTATLTATEAAKLDANETYYSGVMITFAADHTVTAYQSVTMPAGDLIIRTHEFATRSTS